MVTVVLPLASPPAVAPKRRAPTPIGLFTISPWPYALPLCFLPPTFRSLLLFLPLRAAARGRPRIPFTPPRAAATHYRIRGGAGARTAPLRRPPSADVVIPVRTAVTRGGRRPRQPTSAGHPWPGCSVKSRPRRSRFPCQLVADPPPPPRQRVACPAPTGTRVADVPHDGCTATSARLRCCCCLPGHTPSRLTTPLPPRRRRTPPRAAPQPAAGRHRSRRSCLCRSPTDPLGRSPSRPPQRAAPVSSDTRGARRRASETSSEIEE